MLPFPIQEEPLVRAYAACILANIAYLEPGQDAVLQAGGVPPLVAIVKAKDERKVTLHATAAIQNLTYKNTQCCQAVLEQGGEKALKKLLHHKSEDVQQFAAGALANIQLYRRCKDGSIRGESARGAAAAAQAAEMPSLRAEKSSNSVSKRVARILRRRSNDESKSSETVRQDHAATVIQAYYRGLRARRIYAAKRSLMQKKGNRYDVFRVNDVRAELAVLPPLCGFAGKRPTGLDSMGKSGFETGMTYHSGRKPQRLAPLDSSVRDAQATKLPYLDPTARIPPPPMLPPAGSGRAMGVY